MVTDVASENVAQVPLPHSGGGDAPPFFSTRKELLKYFFSLRSADYQTLSGYNQRGSWWLTVGFAALYVLFFCFGDSMFPQFFRWWLDFCMPLVEYVCDLTARADKVTARVIADGYPDKVDVARHRIGIAPIVLIPMVISILAWIVSLARQPLVYVSCTRSMFIKVYSGAFSGSAVFLALGVALYHYFYITWSDLGDSKEGKIHYFSSNIAIMSDVFLVFILCLIFALVPAGIAMFSTLRLIVVKHPPGDKS